jgi:hypothetical protein
MEKINQRKMFIIIAIFTPLYRFYGKKRVSGFPKKGTFQTISYNVVLCRSVLPISFTIRSISPGSR